MTTDFCMQNVMLQIGLQVVSVDGLKISTCKQWALKCHACFKVTRDTRKKFCPSCGNHALMRVSMFVSRTGKVTFSKGWKKFNLQGTKYSLPLPKSGRNAN